MVVTTRKEIAWLEEVSVSDVALVGGKNASLGEMVRELKDKGIRVPDGFATTASAYRTFLDENDLTDKIKSHLEDFRNKTKSLQETGKTVRHLILNANFPADLEDMIKDSYRELSRRYDSKEISVAVRSSATAEDLPEASFAGQQESFLNITGETSLLDACKRCYASLFTNRAINYRKDKGFDDMDIALSIGIQKMVRSDRASSGVIFTIDPETGFRNVIVINSAWGLGESVVQGQVNPDEFIIFKPLLDKDKFTPIISRSLGEKLQKIIYALDKANPTRTVATSREEQNMYSLDDHEVIQLSRWAVTIENHYGKPMDIEWAKDGDTGELFIVQARPETVQSQKTANSLKTYHLKERGNVLVMGLSIGQSVASGKAQLIKSTSEIDRFKDGNILVTGMTDPDWEPIMKRAAGIVTDHGGRTSHAAIVSRELGIPAVVGTRKATAILKDEQQITISCVNGDEGSVYEGIVAYETEDINLENVPETNTDVMMNIASPAGAFRWWQLPAKGIGLARIEFIINNVIKIHPMALLRLDQLKDGDARRKIEELTAAYDDKGQYFIDHLAQGIGIIAASQYPNPVIVRLSDFKTNEYANLIGGRDFEPEEANPMLGFRGASRYYSEHYRDGFALECRAIKLVRETMGLSNVVVMVPFCRTPEEAQQVLEVMSRNGLERGKNGLEVYVMAEVPTNIILAKEFSEFFDGFSIGSNDLTQLTLGVDRDSENLAYLFDEQNKAVKRSIANLIESAHNANRKVGLCGQAPSDHPEFAGFLVEAGIDSISVNPDSVLPVLKKIAETEQRLSGIMNEK